MEQENEVNVEEIDLDSVKKEVDEENLNFSSEINDYRVSLKYEDVPEENLDNREEENLIDFVNNDTIEEESVIKLETTEMIIPKLEHYYCNECGENYDGFCQKCSSLSYILNNIVPHINPESDLNSTPTYILEIRENSSNKGVFALKTLPKSVILGPFDGISAVESTNGFQWKIRDRKFINFESANWMKYVTNASNEFSKNLDIFQFAGDLYFETCREIKENEELTMWLDEEVELDKEEECYFVPVKKEEFPETFACSLCCLGFRLEGCLIEHKSKCPLGKYSENINEASSTSTAISTNNRKPKAIRIMDLHSPAISRNNRKRKTIRKMDLYSHWKRLLELEEKKLEEIKLLRLALERGNELQRERNEILRELLRKIF